MSPDFDTGPGNEGGPARPTPEWSVSLSVVIPAYDEEQSIGSTIERCLAAAATIKARTAVREIEFIVVSDGSTDRTAEIAASFSGIRLLAYARNRGYGAALKAGFAMASGDLLGFMDADGTCDPDFFGDLCRTILSEHADLAIGSRMHDASRMPMIRKFGNRLYAVLLSGLAGRKVDDTASGMRVFRRETLARLLPLPDGLHFTPAMTCRAIFQEGLSLRELPMPYHHREGRSKLHLLKDGLRFFHIIAEIALTYRPLLFFGGMAALLALVGLVYSLGPIVTYITRHQVPSNFIYRLTAIYAAGHAALLLLTIGVVAERVAAALNRSSRKGSRFKNMLLAMCSKRNMLTAGVFPIVAGILLNGGVLREYLTTGQISYHWSYVSLGGFLVLAGMQLAAMGMMELLLIRILERNREGIGSLAVPIPERAADATRHTQAHG